MEAPARPYRRSPFKKSYQQDYWEERGREKGEERQERKESSKEKGVALEEAAYRVATEEEDYRGPVGSRRKRL